VKLIPKTIHPVNAVQIKTNLTIEAGNWLIIYDDERVEIIQDAMMRAFYIPEKVAKLENTIKRGPYQTRKLYSIQINEKTLSIPGQMGRTIIALSEVDFGHGALAIQVARLLSEKDASNVSGRLSEATKLKFATKRIEADGHRWSITNEGKLIAQKLKEII
jgi:hypothetical protein